MIEYCNLLNIIKILAINFKAGGVGAYFKYRNCAFPRAISSCFIKSQNYFHSSALVEYCTMFLFDTFRVGTKGMYCAGGHFCEK